MSTLTAAQQREFEQRLQSLTARQQEEASAPYLLDADRRDLLQRHRQELNDLPAVLVAQWRNRAYFAAADEEQAESSAAHGTPQATVDRYLSMTYLGQQALKLREQPASADPVANILARTYGGR